MIKLDNPTPILRIFDEEKAREFHAELSAKGYAYAKPGIEETPWDTKETTIRDSFGNRLIFFANKGS